MWSQWCHPGTLTTNFHWNLFDKKCMVLKSNTAQCVLHPGAILVQSSPGGFLMGCVVSSLHSVHCTLNTEHYKYTLHTGAKFTWRISYWLHHPVITVVSPWQQTSTSLYLTNLYCTLNTAQYKMDGFLMGCNTLCDENSVTMTAMHRLLSNMTPMPWGGDKCDK